MNTGLGKNFKLVWNDAYVVWIHFAEIKPGFVNLTDMTDDEFEQFIRGLTAQ